MIANINIAMNMYLTIANINIAMNMNLLLLINILLVYESFQTTQSGRTKPI